MSEEINLKFISKSIQLDLAKGELKWEDDIVQFFIPVVCYGTDFDWLKLIAENNLIEEDEKIVKNFLDMVKSLADVNAKRLDEAVEDKIKDLMRDL